MERIEEVLEQVNTLAIAGHIRPDGDCVGACLSMCMYLKKCLPQAQVKVFLEKPADIFHEIKGFEEIDSEFTYTK